MPNIKLSAPWHIHQKKLKAFFELDEAVTIGPVTSSEDGYTVTVKVRGHTKAAALKKILKPSVEFGNVILKVIVEDAGEGETEMDTLKEAFAYNRLVRGVETVAQDLTGTPHTFLVVEPDVTQFFSDNLADYRGNTSMLLADVAADVLNLSDAQICTAALEEN